MIGKCALVVSVFFFLWSYIEFKREEKNLAVGQAVARSNTVSILRWGLIIFVLGVLVG